LSIQVFELILLAYFEYLISHLNHNLHMQMLILHV
jgi:hypothetical protein